MRGATAHPRNIQHSTFNIQHSTFTACAELAREGTGASNINVA
jgi:hypothetical protein